MKSYFTCLFLVFLLFFNFKLLAQPFDIQAGIFHSGGTLEVRAIPGSDINDLVFSSVNFTIRWPNSYNVSLGSSSSSFTIPKNGSEGTAMDGLTEYRYQIFSGTPNVNVTWSSGSQIVLLTVPVNQTGDGTGTFELAQSTFLPAAGEEWFIAIGGTNRTNPSFNSGSTSGVPLPVELSSFTASAKQNAVNLKWQTKTEVNNYGFEVERKAKDSESASWEKVAFVEGNGNSNSAKNYSYTDRNLNGGSKFSYRLKQVDNDGSFTYSDNVEVDVMPDKFELYQNYPNPFNPVTNIKFNLPESGKVRLDIYNIIGQHITTLVDKNMEAGFYNIPFDASHLSTGTYIYRITAQNFSQTKKMILMK